MSYDSDAIRSALPVSEVLAFFGARPLRAGRGPCPLCGTSDGSTCFSSRPSRPSSWHCFACNEGGSSIDLWAGLSGVAFRQALEAMASHLGLDPDRPRTPAQDRALNQKRLNREWARELERLRSAHLSALAAKAHGMEKAAGLYRQAASLAATKAGAWEHIQRALECDEAMQAADAVLAAHYERA